MTDSRLFQGSFVTAANTVVLLSQCKRDIKTGEAQVLFTPITSCY